MRPRRAASTNPWRDRAGGDESHHRPRRRAEQGAAAVRAPERCRDSIRQVEQSGEYIDRAKADVTALHRSVVTADAGRSKCPRPGIDTPDAAVRILVVIVRGGAVAVALEHDAGAQPREIVDVAEALRIELLLAERSHADRNILQPLGSPRRGDDDLFETGARRFGIAHRRRGYGRPQQLTRQRNGQ